VTAGARRVRGAGAPAWTMLAVGSVLAAGLLGVLAVGVVGHLGGVGAPVLPVSWCRSPTDVVQPPLTGMRWLTSWQPDWVATIGALAACLGYLAGYAAVVHRRRAPWPLWRLAAFVAGLGVAVLATTSSIAVYDMTLFSAHMLGHLAFVMVAPPLLAAGRPLTLALHATRAPVHGHLKALARSRAVSLLLSPPVALASYTVVIVGTHLTGAMDAIMAHPWAGQVEHLVYLLVGYQFFALVVGDEPFRWRLSLLARQALLGTAMVVDTFTGVVLLQSRAPVGADPAAPPAVEGLDPLAETHLGGAIMWVGGDAIMAAVMIAVAVAWARRPAGRRRESRSFFGQARAVSFAERTSPTGTTSSARIELDEDEAARLAYNSYLAGLDRHGD
jgi:putative copper resistance protein D